MELLKQQKELEDLKVDYERSRVNRNKELEHERWLQEQKQEIQVNTLRFCSVYKSSLILIYFHLSTADHKDESCGS
jgi:hypothetical protein